MGCLLQYSQILQETRTLLRYHRRTETVVKAEILFVTLRALFCEQISVFRHFIHVTSTGNIIRYAWVFVAVIFLDVIGRPWPPTTLTVFSTLSNFNLVNIRMFDGFRRHAIVFVCSIFSRLLVSICKLKLLVTRSLQKQLWD
jgi:hypothetical protein